METNPEEQWTHSKFKYEFFICLTKVKDPNKSESVTEDERIFLNDDKYYAQAKNLMRYIPITRPENLIPPFVFNLSDLTPKIKQEFKDYCKLNDQREISIFLKEIATKFFENIDYNYTHDSVLSHLVVELRD